MRRRPRNPINPLHLKPKQINSLYTLIHHHRDRRPVALEQLLQVHPEHRFQRGQITRIHRCWSALLLVLWLLLAALLLLLLVLLVRRRVLLEWMGLRGWRLEGEGLELGWSAGGAVGWRGGSSVAHAARGSVIAGLRRPLAEAALVLLVLLGLLLLLLLGGGWWTALVEAGAWSTHWGLLGWSASGDGAGGALTGGEAVESLWDLGLSLCCCCCCWGSRWCHDLCANISMGVVDVGYAGYSPDDART